MKNKKKSLFLNRTREKRSSKTKLIHKQKACYCFFFYFLFLFTCRTVIKYIINYSSIAVVVVVVVVYRIIIYINSFFYVICSFVCAIMSDVQVMIYMSHHLAISIWLFVKDTSSETNKQTILLIKWLLWQPNYVLDIK
jgi:hypothetical protein